MRLWFSENHSGGLGEEHDRQARAIRKIVRLVNAERLRSWELYIIGKLRDSTFVWLGLLVSAVSSLLKSRAAVQRGNVMLPAPNRCCATLPKASAIEFVGPSALGMVFARVAGLAVWACHREARYRDCMAPNRVPDVLDLEDPAWQERASGCFGGNPRPDPPHEL